MGERYVLRGELVIPDRSQVLPVNLRVSGNPPKSWIVAGFPIAVIEVPLVSQCAETHRIAVGFGIDFTASFHP